MILEHFALDMQAMKQIDMDLYLLSPLNRSFGHRLSVIAPRPLQLSNS
jgi:hypothetical protein